MNVFRLVSRVLLTEELQEIFGPFGKIHEAVVMEDSEKKSRGFGFVTFENHEDASKAMSQKHQIGEKTVSCLLSICFRLPKPFMTSRRCTPSLPLAHVLCFAD